MYIGWNKTLSAATRHPAAVPGRRVGNRAFEGETKHNHLVIFALSCD